MSAKDYPLRAIVLPALITVGSTLYDGLLYIRTFEGNTRYFIAATKYTVGQTAETKFTGSIYSLACYVTN